MSALATKPAAARYTEMGRSEMAHSVERLFEPAGLTLEERILSAWEDLTAHGRTECPVCHGELEPRGCATCGSELS